MFFSLQLLIGISLETKAYSISPGSPTLSLTCAIGTGSEHCSEGIGGKMSLFAYGGCKSTGTCRQAGHPYRSAVRLPHAPARPLSGKNVNVY
jgi:hypothetical protein